MNANGRDHYCTDMVITQNGNSAQDISAPNTKYDNMYWTDINAPFVYKDKNWYYLDGSAGAICKGDVLGVNKTTFFNSFGRWYVWGGSGWWTGVYSGFFSDGDRLYFNKSDGIYSINFDGSAITKKYSVDTTTAYDYGCAMRYDFKSGKQKVFVVLNTNPNYAGTVTEISMSDIGIDQNTVTVTYVDSKGLILKQETIAKGGSVTPPADPSDITGYVFDKWDGSSVDVQQDIKIKPVYKPISYSITYNLDGGVNPADAISTYDIETGVSLPEPTYEGYDFGGWYTDSSFSGSKVTSIAKGTTGDKIFYAKWLGLTPDNPKIDFSGSYGKSTSGSIVTYYLDKNCKIVLSDPNATADSEIYYTMDGTIPTKSNGKKYSSPFIPSETSKTIKAVVYRGDRSGGVESVNIIRAVTELTLSDSSITIDVNESKQINVTTKPTTFKTTTVSWSSQDSTIATVDNQGNVTGHKEGKTKVIASTSDLWNRNVTAECEVNVSKNTGKYEVKFVAYDNSVVSTDYVLPGEDANAPSAAKAKNGYKFVSWESYTNITSDTTVYAIYKPIEYTITYNYNGGTGIADAPATYTVESDDITLPTTSAKDNCKFAGWYTRSDLSETSRKTTISKGSTGDVVLYAKWEERKGETPVIDFSSDICEYISGHYTIDYGTYIDITFEDGECTDKIYYTLNNTTPSKESTEYVEPFLLDEGEYTIKAVSYYNDNMGTVTTKKVRVASNELVLSDTSIELKISETKKLSATKMPFTKTAGNITWSVDDSTVVSVSSDGEVTGLSEGSATVSATCNDWNGREVVETCDVTVEAAEIAITEKPGVPSISVQNKDFLEYEGKYIVDAGAKVVISQNSSDTDVLKIDYTTDGTDPTDSSSKLTYSVPLTISKDVTVSAVAIRNEEYSDVVNMEFVVANNSFTLDRNYVSLYPEDIDSFEVVNIPTIRSDDDISWRSLNEKIAEVDKYGNITAIGYGKTTIIASVKDWKNRNVEYRAIVEVKKEGDYTPSIVFNEDYSLIDDKGNFIIDNECAVSLEVNDAEDAYDVYYTTDGTTPTVKANLYDEPIYLEKDSTIKAVIYMNDKCGATFTRKYRVYKCGLEIDREDEVVEIGSELKINVLKHPDTTGLSDIIWSSSDNNVAVVENGVVTAKGTGQAVITATAYDWRDREISVECRLTVLTAIYHVTFYGLHGEFLANISVGEGDSVDETQIPNVPSEINGYRFVEWDNSYSDIYSDQIINAVYVPIEYQISYETNGGSLPEDVCMTYTCEDEDILLPEPEAVLESRFAGWYDNESFEGVPTRYIAKGSFGEKSFYAKWIDEKELYLVWDGKEYGEDLDEITYTGKAIKPGFSVYYGNNLLEAGKDYTYSYKNNVNFNSKGLEKYKNLLVIKGKGNYSGTVTEEFVIGPKSLEDEANGYSEFDIQEVSLKYNKKIQKAKPKVIWKGKTLGTKDVEYIYPDDSEGAYKEPGTYEVIVRGKGNFNDEVSATINIIGNSSDDPILINKYKANIKSFTYTGDSVSFDDEESMEHIKVYSGKKVLTYGEDYELVYGDNYNGIPCEQIGTYTVVVKGCGDYCGEFRTKFSIVGRSIASATISPIASVVYDGNPKEDIELTVTDKNGEIIDGEYYDVSFSNNTNVGTAKVKITGKGLYYGTKTKTFKIVASSIGEDTFEISFANGSDYGSNEIPYTKGGTKPKLNVGYNGSTLKEGKDYSVSYKNYTSVTTEETIKTPYAVITGKKNFKGTIIVPYTIVPADISTLKISVSDIVENSKAGKYISTPVITDSNGKKLVKKTDYETTVTYSSKGIVLDKYSKPVAGDVIEVSVTGTKNYYGTLTAKYRVYAKGKTITTAKVSVKPEVAKNLIYDTQYVTLTKDDLIVSVNSKVLSSQDYDIIESSYTNNINKGKAKVTIIGRGEYAGTKVVTFSIKSYGMKWWQRLTE